MPDAQPTTYYIVSISPDLTIRALAPPVAPAVILSGDAMTVNVRITTQTYGDRVVAIPRAQVLFVEISEEEYQRSCKYMRANGNVNYPEYFLTKPKQEKQS